MLKENESVQKLFGEILRELQSQAPFDVRAAKTKKVALRIPRAPRERSGQNKIAECELRRKARRQKTKNVGRSVRSFRHKTDDTCKTNRSSGNLRIGKWQ